MPRTPARFTQADIARALRALRQEGEGLRMRVCPDGSIVFEKGNGREDMPAPPIEATPLDRM